MDIFGGEIEARATPLTAAASALISLMRSMT
jgi:hypothetical protein